MKKWKNRPFLPGLHGASAVAGNFRGFHLMADKWAKIYVVAVVLLSISVIGMIVSGGKGEFPWFLPAVLSAIACIFARMKMRRKK
jgi:hypothetical protein